MVQNRKKAKLQSWIMILQICHGKYTLFPANIFDGFRYLYQTLGKIS